MSQCHTFVISFSFFQTNTLEAEKLYSVVRDFVGQEQNEVIYDLYCGTGTIAQVLAPITKKVVGIELVAEAVEAAKANATKNSLDNCQFIAGDVMVEVANLHDPADVIILDSPRDLPFFVAAGYEVKKVKCVDLFLHAGHIETVILMMRCGKNDK